MHVNKLYYWRWAFLLICMTACSDNKKEHKANTRELGFEIQMPGEIFTSIDTMRYEGELFPRYTWKSVEDSKEGGKIYYNFILIDFPSHLVHSDSLGRIPLLFNEHEQVFFANAQYSLVDRADLYKDNYPGSFYIWHNISDDTYSCSYYYLVENKMYYMMVHLPMCKSEYVRKKDEFINSFKVLK
ncbi:MAG: hypothetical protein ACRCX1_03205 [Bacteroidales bacterium]